MERPLRLRPPAVLVHGGAGAWQEADLQVSMKEVMKAAEAGMGQARSGSAVEMVVEAVAYMEDSGAFNAGVGAVLDFTGGITMDAAVMRGSDRRAGAVAAVTYPRNPVRLAKAVLENTPHVLIVGQWADTLAKRLGMPRHPGPSQRATDRWRRLKETAGGQEGLYRSWFEAARRLGYDTVGAVAVDLDGITAAAVSTGGVALKLPGRVGDSPIVGAGLYADPASAFSATGVGEYIIAVGLSLRAAIRYEERGDIAEAVEHVVGQVTEAFGPGTVGLIGISRDGTAWADFNTRAMPWAAIDETGRKVAYSRGDKEA
ncbi:MAG: isoaspartyl peptidase/L-asparaginase [Acidilobus sp.]